MRLANALQALIARKTIGRALSLAVVAAIAIGFSWPANAAAADPGKSDTDQEAPTHYLEAKAHANDSVTLEPGGAVSVPYTPRAGDPSIIDGKAPVALPAGSATGVAMAASARGSVWAVGETSPPSNGSDYQVTPQVTVTTGSDAEAHPSAAGNVLRREVYGFLPYWNVGSYLNYEVLSTIAYFGVDLFTNGDLNKTYSDGSPTRGWRGWTSAAMTDTINAAHAAHARVVLTIESFAWDSTGAAAQTALLSSSTARANAVSQIVAAVRDRGADGVNLDFEPIASGQSANFIAFTRELRTAFNAIHAGYEITFCATGHMGNYDPAGLLAPGGADNVFIMGYDFRTGSSPYAASMDPLTSPRVFDLTDAVNSYKAVAPASKIILGLPYYGIAYSTPDTTRYAQNISGTTYGAAVMSPYETAATLALTNLKQYDPIENSAWVSYYGTYGGTSPTWRQFYYDDVQALGARYDRINYWGLGGAGIWALGYDTGFPELNQLLADKFLTDHNPPLAGIVNLPAVQASENFTVAWTARDDWNGVASYDVQISVDGGVWTDWLTGTTSQSSSYDGNSGHNYSFRVRATDGVGNVGAWDVSSTYIGAPAFQVNGYAVVTSGPLNERSQPSASAAVVKTAPTGTIFQFIGGPVSADGYTWYQVTGPIGETSPVTPPFPGCWMAVTNGTTNYMTPVTPPNTTLVSAPIANFSVGAAGSPVVAGVSIGRTFSPDGDGIRDTLPMSWTNQYAADSVTINVYKIDGALAGSISLGGQSAGPVTFAWNGKVDGSSTVLADGRYLLQVAAAVGSSTYYGPSMAPFDSAAWTSFGAILDTTPSGTYFPLAPVRILDTRTGSGPTGALVKDQVRTFAIAGHYGVPANAIAVTGNLTITQPSAAGYVVLGLVHGGHVVHDQLPGEGRPGQRRDSGPRRQRQPLRGVSRLHRRRHGPSCVRSVRLLREGRHRQHVPARDPHAARGHAHRPGHHHRSARRAARLQLQGDGRWRRAGQRGCRDRQRDGGGAERQGIRLHLRGRLHPGRRAALFYAQLPGRRHQGQQRHRPDRQPQPPGRVLGTGRPNDAVRVRCHRLFRPGSERSHVRAAHAGASRGQPHRPGPQRTYPHDDVGLFPGARSGFGETACDRGRRQPHGDRPASGGLAECRSDAHETHVDAQLPGETEPGEWVREHARAGRRSDRQLRRQRIDGYHTGGRGHRGLLPLTTRGSWRQWPSCAARCSLDRRRNARLASGRPGSSDMNPDTKEGPI